MPTPKKRQAEDASGSPSTPRSSKRIRSAQAHTKQEERPTPASTPSRSAKRTKATPGTAPVNGAAVVAAVVKSEPETPSKKRKKDAAADLKAAAAKAEVVGLKPDPKHVQKAVGKQANGHRKDAAGKSGSEDEDNASDTPAAPAKRPKTKRTSKGQPKSGDMSHPLAARATRHALRIGAHVSAAGGVQNSVGNAVNIGANAFALFLKSQRKWTNPALQEEHAVGFVDGCKTHDYAAGQVVVPHGSYLVNLAQSDPEKAAQALDSFIDDLQRCERLGIGLYNFHPGSTLGAPRGEALKRIADALNKAHRATSSVVTLLENMAGAGNIIGGTFDDLGQIIAGVHDKSRVGVCLDTCHAFAYGHDLRDAAAVTATLDRLEKATASPNMLRALHVNDSKAPLGSRRDLHANIGTGFLGLRAFHALVNEPRLHGLPMVLETPIDRKNAEGKTMEDRGVWAREIKLLESLLGMDADSDEFKELEEKLYDQGTAERERIGGQVERKKDKDERKAMGGGKGKGKANTMANWLGKGKKKDVTTSGESDGE